MPLLECLIVAMLCYHGDCFMLGGVKGLAKELLEELAGSVPGIDEAKSFVEVIT